MKSLNLKKAMLYSAKVSLLTIFFGVLIIQILNFLTNGLRFEDVKIDLLIPYVIGFILSIPYVLVFSLIVLWMNHKISRIKQRKITLVLLNIAGLLFVFAVLWQDLFFIDLPIFLPFLLISSMSIYVLKLPMNDGISS